MSVSAASAGEALSLLDCPRSLHHVKAAHARILRLRPAALRDPKVLSKLVRLYAEFHCRPDLAESLLLSVSSPTTFLWNLTIRSHFLSGDPLSSLRLLRLMFAVGVRPDKFTFPFAVRAAAALPDRTVAAVLHAAAIKSAAALYHHDPFLHHAFIQLYSCAADPDSARKVFDDMRARNVVSWTALVSGLIECGLLEDALAVFEAAPERNVVTWTAAIDGCIRLGRPDEAFDLFRRMLREGVEPNEFTLVALLMACTELRSLNLGRWVHELACKNDRFQRSVYVSTALIDMYSKCGSLEDAQRVFDQMPVKTLATWNSMIAGLAVHGRGSEALLLFKDMGEKKVKPDSITFVGLLIACGRQNLVSEGCKLFIRMVQEFGVVPNNEHCKSMAELLEQGDATEEARSELNNLVKELDIRQLRLLLKQCEMHGKIQLWKVICDRLRVLEVVANGTTVVDQDDAFVGWEVG